MFELLIRILQSGAQNSSKVNCPTIPRLLDEWMRWNTMISSGTGFAKNLHQRKSINFKLINEEIMTTGSCMQHYLSVIQREVVTHNPWIVLWCGSRSSLKVTLMCISFCVNRDSTKSRLLHVDTSWHFSSGAFNSKIFFLREYINYTDIHFSTNKPLARYH